MPRLTKLTPRTRARFLEVLRQSCNVSEAARVIGFARQSVYALRERDADFAARWDEAVEQATDTLEQEARRRALEGTLRPIYQGGQLVGHERVYSDTLMCFLLKGHRPERFGDKVRLSGDQKNPLKFEHEHIIPAEAQAQAIARTLVEMGAAPPAPLKNGHDHAEAAEGKSKGNGRAH